MKIMLLGDTHRGTTFVLKAIKVAKQQNCQAIIQLGDFGYWPWSIGGDKFLKIVNNTVDASPVGFYWLDGNHENHEALQQFLKDKDLSKPVSMGAITYLPRGHMWEWGGKRFMSLGGAYSVDRKYRVPNVSFFYDEVIKQADVERALSHDPIDVLLCHDTPECSDPFKFGAVKFPGLPLEVKYAAKQCRLALQHVVDELKPKYVFHGHYHHRYTNKINDNLIVTGLAADGEEGCYTIFDTEVDYDNNNELSRLW